MGEAGGVCGESGALVEGMSLKGCPCELPLPLAQGTVPMPRACPGRSVVGMVKNNEELHAAEECPEGPVSIQL